LVFVIGLRHCIKIKHFLSIFFVRTHYPAV